MGHTGWLWCDGDGPLAVKPSGAPTTCLGRNLLYVSGLRHTHRVRQGQGGEAAWAVLIVRPPFDLVDDGPLLVHNPHDRRWPPQQTGTSCKLRHSDRCPELVCLGTKREVGGPRPPPPPPPPPPARSYSSWPAALLPPPPRSCSSSPSSRVRGVRAEVPRWRYLLISRVLRELNAAVRETGRWRGCQGARAQCMIKCT